MLTMAGLLLAICTVLFGLASLAVHLRRTREADRVTEYAWVTKVALFRHSPRLPSELVATGFIVAGTGGAVLPWSPFLGPLVLICGILVFAGGVVLKSRYALRLRNRAREFSYRLCPRCTYPLPNVQQETRCPECGLAIKVGDAEALWREYCLNGRPAI